MNHRAVQFFTVMLGSLTLAGATSGCVSKGRYNKVLSENQACERRLDESEQRLSSLRQQLRDTYASIAPDQAGQNLSDEELIAQLRQRLNQPQVAQVGGTEGQAQQPRLSIMAKQLFDSGSARLTPEGMNVLNKVATWLSRSDARYIFVEGYTDEVPIGPNLKDRYPTNWELSTARATSVLRYLADQGVSEDRLVALGYGEQSQVTGEGGDTQRQSRRVEIKLNNVEFMEVVASLDENIPQDALIDINQASETELVALPGVTPEMARDIVEYRARAGRINSFDDLQQVRGFDPQKLEALRTMVSYGGERGGAASPAGTLQESPRDIDQPYDPNRSNINQDMRDMEQEGLQERNEMRQDMRDMRQEGQQEQRELEQDIQNPDSGRQFDNLDLDPNN